MLGGSLTVVKEASEEVAPYSSTDGVRGFFTFMDAIRNVYQQALGSADRILQNKWEREVSSDDGLLLGKLNFKCP